MDLDPVLLSRFQFAWVIGWHILMPAFTVGMASYIAILEGFHFATGRQIYLRISMFWIRIFSVAFGVGVVSGVTQPPAPREPRIASVIRKVERVESMSGAPRIAPTPIS